MSLEGVQGIPSLERGFYHLGPGTATLGFFHRKTLKVHISKDTISVHEENGFPNDPRGQILRAVNEALRQQDIYLVNVNYKPAGFGGLIPPSVTGTLYRKG